jgi:hypothetical protein
MNTHGLTRTSPKGEKFLGRCIYCSKDNLSMKAALESCDKAPSQDQQVIDAIEDRRPWPVLVEPCDHDWQEQPGEPPVDICNSCGAVRK